MEPATMLFTWKGPFASAHHLTPLMKALRLALPLALAALLLAGCGSDESAAPDSDGFDLTGTWEIVDEPDQPLSRAGQRYTFAPDSTLRIFRPRTLGPASTIYAVYDFIGDTLAIRSEFDAELLLPSLSNDTLVLAPVAGGRPIMLVRSEDQVETGPPPQPEAPGADGVYSPPADVPPEDMPQN